MKGYHFMIKKTSDKSLRYYREAGQWCDSISTVAQKAVEAGKTATSAKFELLATAKINLRKFIPEIKFTVENVQEKGVREVKSAVKSELDRNSLFGMTTSERDIFLGVLFSPWLEDLVKPKATGQQVIDTIADCKVQNLDNARLVSRQHKKDNKVVFDKEAAKRTNSGKTLTLSEKAKAISQTIRDFADINEESLILTHNVIKKAVNEIDYSSIKIVSKKIVNSR